MPIAKLIDCSSVLRPCTIRKIAHIKSNDNLMHYGIKGMKWGVRRTKEQLAHDRSSIQARMNNKLRTPVKASNGILVTRFSDHALDRTQTDSRPVTVDGILDALKNPLNHGSIKTKTDNLGRPSQQFIGKSATVAVNPENGTITTTSTVPSIYTISKTQLALFMVRPKFIVNRSYNQWLRDVVSSANFAFVSYDGHPDYYYASDSRGVRPVFPVG